MSADGLASDLSTPTTIATIEYLNFAVLDGQIAYLPDYHSIPEFSISRWQGGATNSIVSSRTEPLFDLRLTGDGSIFFKAFPDSAHISQIQMISGARITTLSDETMGDAYRYAVSRDGKVIALTAYQSPGRLSFYVGKRIREDQFSFLKLPESQPPHALPGHALYAEVVMTYLGIGGDPQVSVRADGELGLLFES